MADTTELCGCGEPLHYTDRVVEAQVRALVDELGELVTVTAAGQGSYRVPRHYIALHGLAAEDVAMLAELYGWEPA